MFPKYVINENENEGIGGDPPPRKCWKLTVHPTTHPGFTPLVALLHSGVIFLAAP